jgi:hypothetical protein
LGNIRKADTTGLSIRNAAELNNENVINNVRINLVSCSQGCKKFTRRRGGDKGVEKDGQKKPN